VDILTGCEMKTFITAEIGINHNGDLNIAKQLIKGAKDAGCDAVKFQKRTIYKVYTKKQLSRPVESPYEKTYGEQKERLEFGRKEYDEIDDYCRGLDILWYASAWDLESFEFLKRYSSFFNKVASPMIYHTELLKRVAKENKYTFISTGIGTMEDINKAVKIFESHKCPFELLHCNNQYPMPDNKANLNCIKTLKDTFGCSIGYSGHEAGLIISVAAVVLGATSIERHITLDRSMFGTDHSSSVEIDGIRKLVKYIRTIEVAIGDGVKRVGKIKAGFGRKEDL